jgi:hypothetical protein
MRRRRRSRMRRRRRSRRSMRRRSATSPTWARTHRSSQVTLANNHCFGQCCGSGMFILDPHYFHPRSRVKKIPGSRIRIRFKEFKYFNPKNCFQALGNMIQNVHSGSAHTEYKLNHFAHTQYKPKIWTNFSLYSV